MGIGQQDCLYSIAKCNRKRNCRNFCSNPYNVTVSQNDTETLNAFYNEPYILLRNSNNLRYFTTCLINANFAPLPVLLENANVWGDKVYSLMGRVRFPKISSNVKHLIHHKDKK